MTLPAQVPVLSELQLTGLLTEGQKLVSTTPNTCVVIGTRVVFLNKGTCRLEVVHGRSVIRKMTTTVVGSKHRTAGTTRLHRAAVSFRPDSAILTQHDRVLLDQLISQMRNAHVVTVSGRAAHPGGGTEAVASRLAAHRADAVAAYLRKHGVRVTVVQSMGDTHTVPGGLAANRRADIAWL